MDLTFHSRGYLHFGISERVAKHLHPTYHLPGAPAAAGYLPSLSPNKEGGQAHQEEDSSKCIQGILGVDGLLPLHAMSLSRQKHELPLCMKILKPKKVEPGASGILASYQSFQGATPACLQPGL
ncbi:hypothetical protein GH733_015555 [Mirounga leonina]|nr:hypothetical protein GH733_015555 [Mirounga leonina]